MKPWDDANNGATLIGIYADREDRWYGPGLVKEGRLIRKGGEGGFETRGKEVDLLQTSGRKATELAVND